MSQIAYIDKVIEDLVPGFMEDRKKEVDRIEALMEKKNFGEIEEILKIGKESSSTFGFKALASLYISAFNASKKGDDKRIRELMGEMKSHLDNVKIVYVEYGGEDEDSY